MELPDCSSLSIAPDSHPLLLSSRPGYLLPYSANRRARESFVSAMKDHRVRLAVVLLTADEMEAFYRSDLCSFYARRDIEPLHYPIVDGSIPDDPASFHELVRVVRHRLRGGTVLVHCNAGLGRTGTVAAGLLVHEGAAWDQAISRVRKTRNGALENRWQEQFVREYATLRTGRNHG